MATRKRRKKKKSKNKRTVAKRKRVRNLRFLVKFIKGIFSVVILSGFLIGLFLCLENLPFLVSKISSKIGISGVGDLVLIDSSQRKEAEDGSKEALGSQKTTLTIGLIADSEGDNESLEKALDGLNDRNVDAVFFLGDLTQYGSLDSLRAVKDILNRSELKVLIIPGDHDLAASADDGDLSGRRNFREVFGDNIHLYESRGHNFMLFDNSPNFSKISEEDLAWFENNLPETDFVILSQPLYHPTNQRVMGMFDGDVVSTVRAQAEEMLTKIRESNVKAIIAADQHFFSKNTDPERADLLHIVVGALISNKGSFRNPQSSRYAILKIYENGNYKVEEIVL